MGELEKAVAHLDVAVHSTAARHDTQRLGDKLRKKPEQKDSHGG
jgi:hypothetical protein